MLMAVSRHFLTFADSRFSPSLARISSEARQTGVFDTVNALTERCLDRSFRRKNRRLLSPAVRGFGYWIWKPQAILQTLRTLPDGDMLAYCDVGCRFTQEGRNRLEEYFTQASESAVKVAAFKYDPPRPPFPHDGRQLFDLHSGQWTKGDLLTHFQLQDDAAFVNDYCFVATAVFLVASASSREFVEAWLEVMESDTHLIDDSPSRSPNKPEFIEHRHDQAVFNCLAYRHKVSALCGYEIQYPGATPQENDWETIRDYPIHARREKTLSRSGRLWTRMHRAWARLRGTVG